MSTLQEVEGRGKGEVEWQSEMETIVKRLKAVNSRKHFYIFIP